MCLRLRLNSDSSKIVRLRVFVSFDQTPPHPPVPLPPQHFQLQLPYLRHEDCQKLALGRLLRRTWQLTCVGHGAFCWARLGDEVLILVLWASIWLCVRKMGHSPIPLAKTHKYVSWVFLAKGDWKRCHLHILSFHRFSRHKQDFKTSSAYPRTAQKCGVLVAIIFLTPALTPGENHWLHRLPLWFRLQTSA